MSYVIAGYSIVAVVLFAYALGVLRQANAARSAIAGMTRDQGATDSLASSGLASSGEGKA